MTDIAESVTLLPGAVKTLSVHASDGARADLCLVGAEGAAARALLWLPALGVGAHRYLPLAQALAARGVAVALHEWRGTASSDLRPRRGRDWGYRELLTLDLPASLAAARAALPRARWAIGGHSLGGQLAALRLALAPGDADALVLAASGSPYWRTFPRPQAWTVRTVQTLFPLVARLRGHYPGRRFRFAGDEARGVIADWAASGRAGRYAVAGMAFDFEAALRALTHPVYALRFAEDALGPAASLRWLLDKLPAAPRRSDTLDAATLGVAADHFAWMRQPDAVAARIAQWLGEVVGDGLGAGR
ncbi:putative alpha/beta hydrolase [Mizugakiibacter sediminis]|uniref:Putative alpha/beta hydrolase n=1 Tax=Mizugakiibacter sediminis TaxID=1475481 RepID=A0A0K8QL84_9GAMM|nr:alpha/beta fold hydrolase [Mizugakiibacter sediminis]GAP65471.1 putative alpha/beta hydrolase [Mizugakiibacter sediminis]